MTGDDGRSADREQIARGLAAYCRYADLNRPADQGALFLPDCRASYGRQAWIEGREALVERLSRSLGAYSATSHLLGLPEIDFDGADRASVTTPVHAWHRPTDDRPDVVLYGRYVDSWTRTDEGWRIAVREFQVAGVTGRDASGLSPLGPAGAGVSVAGAQVVVAGYLDFDPAHREGALRAFADVVAASRTEPGCVDYAFSPDPDQPGAGPGLRALGRRRRTAHPPRPAARRPAARGDGRPDPHRPPADAPDRRVVPPDGLTAALPLTGGS